MNIHEIARRSGATLSTLKKLERLGVLKVEAESEVAAPLRTLLGRNQSLSLAQILLLVENADTLGELGKWEDRARDQIATLGDISSTPVPAGVPTACLIAASGDVDALDHLADWVQASLPPGKGVSFHWLAIRIVMAQHVRAREQSLKSINLAFGKLRGRPKMAGWWHSVPLGMRNTIIYQRPLDL